MTSSVVLIPTYNERENLRRLAPILLAKEDVHVLVIDDSSPDGTGEIAEELTGRYKRLSVLHRSTREGLGPAYVHGFREALKRGHDRIVTMDADLSHDPADVPRLLDGLRYAQVAIGSRHVPGGRALNWSVWRHLISRLGSFYARTLLRLSASDVTSGFRAYRAEALRAIDLEGLSVRGFAFQIEVLRKILEVPGSRAMEVPIVFRNRVCGCSKFRIGMILEGAVHVLRSSRVFGDASHPSPQ